MSLKPLRILLIEDSVLDAKLIKLGLSEIKFSVDVEHVVSLSVAAQRLQDTAFDIVLLDLNLRETGGLDTLAEFLKLSVLTPVIVVTGMDSEALALKALEYGAQDYLVKDKNVSFPLAKAIQFAIRRQRTTDQLHENIALLERATRLDPLTGVLNRRGLDEGLQQLWNQFVEHKKPMACVMIDLDHFKTINDRFGHAVGDEAIKAFAVTLASRTRNNDLICRLGGEEFCVLMPNIDELMAWRWAEKVRAAIVEEKFNCRGHLISLTASFGVCGASTNVQSGTSLLEAADRALYQAKNRRNCVGAYSPIMISRDIDIPTVLQAL